MVRASRQWPNVYFGKPGAFTTLPYPRGDMDKPYERLNYDFVTGSGQHAITSFAYGSRPYTLTWNAMHGDNFGLIEQYWTGMMGSGPWAFIDPSRKNMLLPNAAAATSTIKDTTDLVVSGTGGNGGTLFSNTAAGNIHRVGAPRSLRWQFTVSPFVTRPTLSPATPYRNWFGHPAVVGLPYTFSCWIKADGIIDSSIGINMRLRWVDATGTLVSDSGNPGFPLYTTVTGSWVRLFVTGTAPAGAYYVQPGIVVDDTTLTLNCSLYVDELQFEQDDQLNDWAPGTGLRAVEILGLSETVPFDARWRKGMALTLREVAT